ncbi:MAG: hypothetical protein KF817_08415 [Phycisphaeraceae bacterium]|nr:hypothetical protein [Phycisphaeraceae bacterium]
MNHIASGLVSVVAASLIMTTSTASASYSFSVTQTSEPAPQYANLVTFDEPGTPTGWVPFGLYQSVGFNMASTDDPSGFNIGDVSDAFPWLGTGNVAYASSGLLLRFHHGGARRVSFQGWGDAGPAGPFGGFLVWILDEEGNVLSEYDTFTPAWDGLGNTWYNIAAYGSARVQYLLISNKGDEAGDTYIDNLSWSLVPAPGAFALFAVAGLARARRRR